MMKSTITNKIRVKIIKIFPKKYKDKDVLIYLENF